MVKIIEIGEGENTEELQEDKRAKGEGRAGEEAE